MLMLGATALISLGAWLEVPMVPVPMSRQTYFVLLLSALAGWKLGGMMMGFGFIVLLEDGRARIVADELGYTNECLVHPDGKRLFVNETFARRLTSFDIAANGDLSNRQTVAQLGEGKP